MLNARHRLSVFVALALAVLGLGAALPGAAQAATVDQYAALGDSFSSGVGTNSYAVDAACKRSSYAYPYLLSQQRPNTALTFAACSGAKTTDVVATQLTSLNAATTIVTISVGGNDLGFADLIAQCVTADCNASLGATKTSAAAVLTPKLDSVYTAIRAAAPNARVIVLGYPRLLSTASCLGTTGISASERTNANALADEIDRITASTAAKYGFTYKSAIAAFTGHAVCSSSAWINGLNLFNTAESFHPNRTGQSSGYLALVRSVTG